MSHVIYKSDHSARRGAGRILRYAHYRLRNSWNLRRHLLEFQLLGKLTMGVMAAPFSKKNIHTIKTQRAMSFQFFLKDQRASPDVSSISECSYACAGEVELWKRYAVLRVCVLDCMTHSLCIVKTWVLIMLTLNRKENSKR